MYYLNSRYYDPGLGRFINIDDISVINDYKDTLNGLNLFAYCINNPIMFTDESGRGFWDWLLGIVLAVAAVAVAVVVTVATGGVATTMLIGAGIGAAVGFTSSIVTQIATTGTINAWSLLTDTIFGAITGLLGGSALGIVGSMATMGMTGFASSIVSDLVQGKEVNYGKAILSGLLSMVLGASAGAQFGLTSKVKGYQVALNGFNKAVQAGQYSLRGGNGVLNLAKYRLNNATNILKYNSIKNLFNNWMNNFSQMNIFYQTLFS